jgi:hypothetical protein
LTIPLSLLLLDERVLVSLNILKVAASIDQANQFTEAVTDRSEVTSITPHPELAGL